MASNHWWSIMFLKEWRLKCGEIMMVKNGAWSAVTVVDCGGWASKSWHLICAHRGFAGPENVEAFLVAEAGRLGVEALPWGCRWHPGVLVATCGNQVLSLGS